jgi:hypothetical protein
MGLTNTQIEHHLQKEEHKLEDKLKPAVRKDEGDDDEDYDIENALIENLTGEDQDKVK